MLGAGFSHSCCLWIMDRRHWTVLAPKTLEITLVPSVTINIVISTVEGHSFTGGQLLCRRYHHWTHIFKITALVCYFQPCALFLSLIEYHCHWSVNCQSYKQFVMFHCKFTNINVLFTALSLTLIFSRLIVVIFTKDRANRSESLLFLRIAYIARVDSSDPFFSIIVLVWSETFNDLTFQQ